MIADIPQLKPKWIGEPLSPREQAKLDAIAAAAAAEAEEWQRQEDAIRARSTAIPGSLDDLRECGAIPGSVGRFEPRHRELLAAIEADPTKCCGEWQQSGYYGWCSRLGRPTYFREQGRTDVGIPILQRCDRCPVAIARERDANESEAWIESFFSFLEDLTNGNGIGAAVRR